MERDVEVLAEVSGREGGLEPLDFASGKPYL